MPESLTTAGNIESWLEDLFPFHMVFDQELRLLRAGLSLQRIIPEAAQSPLLHDVFTIERPHLARNFLEISAQLHSIFLLRSRATSVALRGQMRLSKEGYVVYLCEPWLSDFKSMKQLGLRLEDFPKHSATPDFLMMLQSQTMDIRDNQELLAELEEQTHLLQRVNQELSVQSAVTPVLGTAQSIEEASALMLKIITETFKWREGAFFAYKEGVWSQASAYNADPSQEGPLGSMVNGPCLPLLEKLVSSQNQATIHSFQESPCLKCLSPWSGTDIHLLSIKVQDNHGLSGLMVFGSKVEQLEDNIMEMLSAMGEQLAHFIARARTEEALRRSKTEAEQANRTKSRFLANMSHELRTPLNAVIGYSELLLEDEYPDAFGYIKNDLEKINHAGSYLLSLVNNILDLGKIETGKVDLSLESFPIESFISSLKWLSTPLINQNHNTLMIDVSPDIPAIYTDQLKLKQILFNLLSNAAKFTQKGKISLRVSAFEKEGEGWLCFEVNDQGVGISNEDLPKIFEAYTQLNISTQSFVGSGLGLAICKHYSEILGGSIKATSQPGVGSCFRVELPARWDPPSHPLTNQSVQQ